MATAFRRKGAHLAARLSAQERAMIADLLLQTAELVALPDDEPTGDVFTDLMAGMGEGPDPAEVAGRDSALRRLLPDGNREDPEASAEFRRLTENDLRRAKADRLRESAKALREQSGGKTVLGIAVARDLMIALTDVRLVLADRLGLETDEDTERLHAMVEQAEGPGDPELVLYSYYDFLTWIQESLAQALLD